MTSRSKQLLEDVMSSLWELETARQRQKRLVLGILAAGDAETEHETLRWQQQKHLQAAPSGVMAVLQQQLSELTMDSNTEDNLDGVFSSGFYEQNEIQSLRHSRSSPSLSFYSHRGRSDDAYMLDWEGQKARPFRTCLPRSFSAPYPPLEGIAEGIEDAEDDDNETLWSKGQTLHKEDMNRTDAGSIINLNEVGGPIGIHCDHQGPTVEEDEGPTAEDIQQAMRVETYILGLLQRYCLNQTPDSTDILSSASDFWQDLHAYPPNYCEQPENSEWQKWEVFSDGKAPQDRYYLENEADQFSQVYRDPGSSLESTTITGDIDSHSLHHPCVSPSLHSKSLKQDWEPTALELMHQLPLARRYQEESWSSVGQRHVKTTNQSQSEDSIQSQLFTSKPGHEYHTLSQDVDINCFTDDFMSSQRLWNSTADLSQEEKRLLGEKNLPFYISSQSKYTKQKHHTDDKNPLGAQGDGSDSSLSETCSPGSSSKSSGSDESGGLVWPQQVPPCVPSFSQNAPTAMVRIKASHALKRKILRFRSGSLKVMTTV